MIAWIKLDFVEIMCVIGGSIFVVALVAAILMSKD